MSKSKRSFFEVVLNKSTSITVMLNRLFRFMLITLGLITAFSAIREVNKEVKSCLDERFHAVLYVLADRIEEYSDIDYFKNQINLEEYMIGKRGTTAVIKIDSGEVNIEAISSNELTTEKIKKLLNSEEMINYIKESERPKMFMKHDFKVKPITIFNNLDMYKMRVGSTSLENVYTISIAGPDEYSLKIIRIFMNAITLTLIVVPITLIITGRIFAILSRQIAQLDSEIIELSRNNELNFKEIYITSKNEIGSLANSVRVLANKLEEKSYIDELTGMPNKRKLYKYLKELEIQSKEDEGYISVLFLDIDYFKKYNDNYGHVKGDEILKNVGDILQKVCIEKGIQGFRFGGEEFIIVADNCNETEAIDISKVIQNYIKEASIEHKYSDIADVITLSIGINICKKDNLKKEYILTQSDKALYEAKKEGRNRYVIIKN